jgi:translation initiation factor IF-1
MAKNDNSIEIQGTVLEDCGNTRFRVGDLYKIQTNPEGHVEEVAFGTEETRILCHIGGKLRKHNITIMEGDEVTIKVSPYDLTRGIITYRTTGKKNKGNRR